MSKFEEDPSTPDIARIPARYLLRGAIETVFNHKRATLAQAHNPIEVSGFTFEEDPSPLQLPGIGSDSASLTYLGRNEHEMVLYLDLYQNGTSFTIPGDRVHGMKPKPNQYVVYIPSEGVPSLVQEVSVGDFLHETSVEFLHPLNDPDCAALSQWVAGREGGHAE